MNHFLTLNKLPNLPHQALVRHRLGLEGVATCLFGLQYVLREGMCRKRDDGDMGGFRTRFDPTDRFPAIHFGKSQIHQYQIRDPLLCCSDTGYSVHCLQYKMTLPPQEPCHNLLVGWVILNNQYQSHTGSTATRLRGMPAALLSVTGSRVLPAGRRRVNVEP